MPDYDKMKEAIDRMTPEQTAAVDAKMVEDGRSLYSLMVTTLMGFCSMQGSTVGSIHYAVSRLLADLIVTANAIDPKNTPLFKDSIARSMDNAADIGKSFEPHVRLQGNSLPPEVVARSVNLSFRAIICGIGTTTAVPNMSAILGGTLQTLADEVATVKNPEHKQGLIDRLPEALTFYLETAEPFGQALTQEEMDREAH